MKRTKHALLLSAVSMLLCLSMLVGSTFAWFTDTASTGVNKIVAGNLDIKLSYKNAATENKYEEVALDTEGLFLNEEGEEMLWEPGAVSVCYFMLENKGSLAIKYELGALVKDVVVGADGAALSKVLKASVVELNGDNTYTTRADAIAAAKGADAKNIVEYKKYGTMEKDAAPLYFAMIIYFPEEIGNIVDGAAYNRSDIKLETDIQIKLGAAQQTAEIDSFDNQYDVGAPYPVIPDAFNNTISGTTPVEPNGRPANDVVIENGNLGLKATIPAENYRNNGETEQEYNTDVTFKLVDSSTDSTTYEIEVTITDKDGQEVPLTEPAVVEIELVKGLKNVVVTHNGNSMNAVENNAFTADQQYSYNAATGILAINSKTFSPFEITYETNYQATVNGVGYLSLRSALLNAQPGETVVVQQNWGYNYSTAYALAVATENVTLDLNGYIVASNNRYVIAVLADNFTVKNGQVQALGLTGGAKQTAIMFQGVNGTVENVDILVRTPMQDVYSGAVDVLTFASKEYLIDAEVNINNVNIKEIVADGAQGAVTGVYVQGCNIADNTLYKNTAVANITNCDIKVNGFAAGGNGSTHGTEFNITDSKLSAYTGIYHPQYGTLNVVNSEIAGEGAAIEMRSGNLNITSGTFTSTGDPFNSEGNLSGITMLGTAIAVSQHTTELPINVTVNGGTFNGVYAIYEDDTVENQAEKSKDVSITINGGTFNGEIKSINNKIIDNR